MTETMPTPMLLLACAKRRGAWAVMMMGKILSLDVLFRKAQAKGHFDGGGVMLSDSGVVP
jgi:hypothetical protein